MPSLYFSTEPVTSATRFGVLLLTPEQLDAIGVSFGGVIDPERGHMSVTVYDCNETYGIGVQFDIGVASDTDTVLSYGPGEVATTTGGTATIGNVIPGGVDLLAKLEQSGNTIAALSAQVRPGTVTWVRLHAAPDQ